MIQCIEEAHKMKWIHRDVKPDNFLIDASGHLKISDFGLAFDGHWSHSQMYYANQRETLLEKIGIKVKGDEFDVAEDIELAGPERNWKPPSPPRRYATYRNRMKYVTLLTCMKLPPHEIRRRKLCSP